MPLPDAADSAIGPELGHRALQRARRLAHLFSQRGDRFARPCTHERAELFASLIEFRCCAPLRCRPRRQRPSALAVRRAPAGRPATQRALESSLRGLTDFVDVRRDQRLDRVRELFGAAWGLHQPRFSLDARPFNATGERLHQNTHREKPTYAMGLNPGTGQSPSRTTRENRARSINHPAR
jgi:hypothetical protein